MRPSARSPPNNSDMIRRFEEEIEVGTWSGALSVQTGSRLKGYGRFLCAEMAE